MDFKKVKNEKGITLIALAVTIVVLLILAGVTISSVFSENGIIKKAQQAQTKMDEAKEKDLAALNELEKELAKYQGENINPDDYETLTLKTYVGRFHKQCVNYTRAYIEVYDKENEANSVIFNIGTDWDKNIDTTNDADNDFFIDGSTNLEMIQNFENLNTSEYTADTKEISPILVGDYTDVEITFKAKKEKNYGVKVLIQGAHIEQDDTIKIVDRCIYSGDFGENNKKTVTRNEVTGTSLYIIYDTVFSQTSILKHGHIINGSYGLQEYCYTSKDDDSKKMIRLLNETATEAVDEKFIGFDYNRDGYIDANDTQQAQLVNGNKSRW